MELVVLFGSFIAGLIFGLPIAVALGVASFSYILYQGLPLVIIPQRMFAGLDVFVLLSIPGFILAGNLMNAGGITERIVRFANALVGWMRGGLGQANIASSLLFGGVSGTAVADAASIGGVMIPGMKRAGYPAPFAAAVTAASSTVGPMIPPSVPMIIVGALSGLSVGRMFLAGAIPGLLLGLAMMITCYIVSRRNNYPVQAWQGLGELGRAFVSAVWALAMTGLIIGGLVTGVATPTETAVIACLYAFVVGYFVYGGLRLRDVPRIVVQSGVSSAAILALVGFANVFGWILSTERIPQAIVGGVLSVTENRILIILLINLVLLFVGMFMETIAALIILFVPLLALATSVGIDPIHFATFAVLNLMLGLTTPPLGVCLFVCGSIARVSLPAIVRAIAPFLLCNLTVLMLVAYIPALSTWLPELVFGR